MSLADPTAVTPPHSILDPPSPSHLSNLPSQTLPSKNPNNVSSRRRGRELYKYFRPDTFEPSLEHDSATNNLLTSQAQLVALQLGGKVLINFLDDRLQYVIAEADGPSTLHLDTSALKIHEEVDDAVWTRCRGQDDKSNSVCRITVEAAHTGDDAPPAFFEVPDLKLDDRFSAIPLVTGAPHLRYYGGVPLFTNSGIAIGALVVVDKHPRATMTEEDIRLLHHTAKNIMRILELHRRSRDERRSVRMNKCLGRFISTQKSSIPSNAAEADTNQEGLNGHDSNIFRDATDRLSEALGDDCGVAFLDTVGISTPYPDNSPGRTRSASNASAQEYPFSGKATTRTQSSRGPSPVLASSATGSEGHLIPLPLDRLSVFAERYSQGMLWTFEDHDCVGSPDHDGQYIRQHLPRSSSVWMKTIWNAQANRTVVCICWSNSDFRVLTNDHEAPFLSAACNTLAVELVRLATVASDEQKSDFMRTISHELRSPLHGILASCDLLAETDLSRPQESLIRMVNSCGRTLLDTLSMVLDWSKVNAFERDWRALGAGRRSSNSNDCLHAAAQARLLPNLYGNVDLAAVVEEVVEGIVLGQGFKDVHEVDLTDLGSAARGRAKSTGTAAQPIITTPQVEVLLDIARPAFSWVYLTQPGAFRRLLLNLVGNALKFTDKGHVMVRLQTSPMDQAAFQPQADNTYDNVVLTIEDTGRGMSHDFLRHRAFTPFSQEDALATGTGLGLSLAKSICAMLEGTINISSTPKAGTIVTVTIPMSLSPQQRDSAALQATPSSSGSIDAISLDLVHRLGQYRQLAFYHPEHHSTKSSPSPLQESLASQLLEWFHLDLVEYSRSTSQPDVVFVDDTDLSSLLDSLTSSCGSGSWPSIVALCSDVVHFSDLMSGREVCGRLDIVAKPVGPFRLMKTLQSCLRHLQMPTPDVRDTDATTGAVEGLPDVVVHDLVPDATSGMLFSGSRGNIPGTDAAVNQDSANAHMILPAGPPTTSTSQTSDPPDMEEYPFPVSGPMCLEGEPIPKSEIEAENGETSITPVSDVKHIKLIPPPPPVRQMSELPPSTLVGRAARILVVDDNAINLSLIATYMKKLKYTHVVTASDGRKASDTFRTSLEISAPYDVIWMDLSMPVLDGFEATREIRQLEAGHAARLPPLLTPSPAMIVALTGLASEKDRARAFEAGVDLYMTKPATFKEVGRLMKNWEANGGVKASDTLPHGPVTGSSAAVS